MNHLKIIAFLLLPILVSGCFDSNLDDCPPPESNLTIHYNLSSHLEREVFTKSIGKVDLYVFDAQGRFNSKFTAHESDLLNFRGKKLAFKPGTYTMFAWANVTDSYSGIVTNPNSTYTDPSSSYLLTSKPQTPNTLIPTGDPLYYASVISINVPATGKTEVTATLTNAHHKVDITVKGYVPPMGSSGLTMQLTNITTRFSFLMALHGDLVNYTQSAGFAPGNSDYHSVFNVPLLNNQTPTEVKLFNHNNELLIPPIKLDKLLESIKDLPTHLTIPIIITIGETMDVGVTVNLPGWSDKPSKPLT